MLPSTASSALERKGSGAGVTATQSAAEAFGDDIADDAYSVSELSHYNEEGKKDRKAGGRFSGKGKGPAGANFSGAKLSAPQRMGSVSAPDDANGSSINAQSSQHASSGSNDPSDEIWGGPGTGGDNGIGTITLDDRRGSTSGDNESDDSDLFATSSFASFALTRFQSKMPYVYACCALPHPLLPQPDRADYLAALASWVTLLRIMGDLPDVDTGHSIIVAGTEVPLTIKVKVGFKAKYTKKDLEDAHIKYSELFKDPTGVDTGTIPFLGGRADTMLDKVQFVCALGIYRPNLRDELYCQLCKQLTNNPSKNSTVRGWVLMSLFAGSFTPSERFAPSLTSFLREGPPEFSEKVDKLLRRTCGTGTRGYPASWLEFQSAKNGKPLLVPVTFMNGHRLLCEVDSATTVCEMIQNIKERLEIQDVSGFSVYISLQNKISCLGHGQHRVMDAISECEQHTKEMGLKESSSLWRLFFRREYFTPWYGIGKDIICTDLDYQQIKRGIAMGEYRIPQDVLIKTAAELFYIENTEDPGFNNLHPFVTTLISDDSTDKEEVNSLVAKVKAECERLELFKTTPLPLAVKCGVVAWARDSFYALFSRYYDAAKVVIPEGTLQDVTISVNNRGVFILEGPDKLRLHIQFPEILEASKSKHQVTLTVVSVGDILLNTAHADDLCLLVNSFIEGLKQRAMLAIAKQDVTPLDGPPDSNIIRGDVVKLGAPIPEDDQIDGDANVAVRNVRTGHRCEVPTKTLHLVAPDTAKPSDELMERLAQHIRKNPSPANASEGKQLHTLQHFAKNNFRPSGESTMTKLFNKASIKRKDVEHLWSFSRDALKKPLLKRTLNRDDIRKLACHCFTSIQTYMTNLVINDELTNYNLCSDWILNPARRNKYLRDEIYCQILKQITNNPEQSSASRGWVLFALLSALTAPSKELLDECLQFCAGSTHPLARQCERNLKRRRARGGCRLYSCHYLEHEMVSRQHPNIRLQVYLPNQSVQTLEVTSHTQIFDMKKEIAGRLQLKSFSEYSIFMSSQDRVHCLSDKSFYFDALSHAEVYWFKTARRNASQKQGSGPMVVMLKKIWVNGQPGVDKVADQVFHYCQEMPNYIRGYHQIEMEKIPKLAALVFRSQFGSDDKALEKFRDIGPRILPTGFLDGKKESTVIEAIQTELSNHKDITPLDAKIAFLTELSRFTTYGSVFFEVKQRYVKSLPKYCLIAINYLGVHIIDQNSKDLIKTFEFYTIPNWAHDETSFTFIISDSNRSTWKLLVETNVGHNMDDLLMSYVAWIMNYQMRKKHGFVGTEAGESIC